WLRKCTCERRPACRVMSPADAPEATISRKRGDTAPSRAAAAAARRLPRSLAVIKAFDVSGWISTTFRRPMRSNGPALSSGVGGELLLRRPNIAGYFVFGFRLTPWAKRANRLPPTADGLDRPADASRPATSGRSALIMALL